MTFTKWLDTFITEKEIDLDRTFEKIGPETGWNLIPVGVVVEHMKIANPIEQAEIKKILVMIDFKNGDVYHFFDHLAGALAR